MRYLITGVTGQLGYEVVKELKSRGINDIYAPVRSEMDLSNLKSIDDAFDLYKPDVVFHCAAYTAVDKAENDKETCETINFKSTEEIAKKCSIYGAKLVYISTDYVFDGTKPLNEEYEIDDIPNPKNVYGLTKLKGELAAAKNPKTFIARTSWVFGINGNNFVKTMINLGDKYPELRVVADQFGSPTYAVDLAKLLVDMSETDKYGIYHANNEGYCSWAEFASEIMKQNDKPAKVTSVTTDEYYAGKDMSLIAYRPKNSKLSKISLDEAGFKRLPEWQDALDRYSKELKKQNNKSLKLV